MGKRQKQVIYFCEGETEENLLGFLKKTDKIKAGNLKKFNLWTGRLGKIQIIIGRTKEKELFFVIDTDDVTNVDIFVENIKLLKSYNICLIIQHKNLEDELCFSCKKPNHSVLFNEFYNTSSQTTFKRKFKNEKNLEQKLADNKFNFDRLWCRDSDFSGWLDQNNISISINCNYKI